MSVEHQKVLPRPVALPVLANNISAILKSQPAWVLWRYELKNGRWTKPPFQPSEAKASTTKSSTWISFDSALAHYERGKFDGVGIVLTDGIAGLDLDHVVKENVVDEWAQSILSRFSNTYIERSPGGDGLRIFCRGIVTKSGKSGPDNRLEVYDKKSPRFLTVTGHSISAANDVTEQQPALDWLHREWFVEPSSNKKPDRSGIELTDAEILNRASTAKNSRKFSALFAGDAGGDQSSADMALCCLLAFWTRNETQIDRLFRRGGLMREKWDEKRGDETYGSITIAKALNTVSEIYSSSAHTTKGDAPGWKDQGDRAGVSPDLGCDDETNGGSAAPPEDAAALAFAEQYAGRLLWCQERGRWLAWDSTRWVEDRTVLGMDLCRKFCRELNGKGVRRAQYIAAIERLAKTDRRLAAVPEQFDAHEFEINTPTGIVDLRTGHTITHDSYHYHTKITGVAPFGECPRWLGFLFQITRGDADLQSYLQRVAGYAITGSVREHALFFLYGSGGNGKSTFLDALHYCLGAYAVSAPMNMFTAVQGERHPTDLASLAGAHLVTASETEQGRRWDEVRIKALTGGDPVKARFMHGNFFEYRPTFKLIIAGNNKPQLQSVDEAMRRRLHLVPFTANIPLASRDLDLPAKLREEASGILAWVLEGCRMWQHMGLNPPQCVLDATAEYLATQDSLAAWIEERCVTGAAQWDTPGRLYADWKGYAEKSGENPGTLKVFGDRLEAHGFPRGRTMSYRMHSGLSVKDGDAARAAVLPGSHPWSRQA